MQSNKMDKYSVKVFVSFKPGINDPQAITIAATIYNLGFENISNFSTGKLFHFSIQASSITEAKKTASEICEKLLANPVIENYEVEVN
ncbi:MAG: phosphoribosylformylglycinamidine synthase [Dehalococcoidia bacterium]|nr:phosphoribosylformylglycinamidine synthase [Dehalococcoidia bacterium]|tara:strand:- start:201 stop:464 length:264 start_codon:yes stop_codon:yes gene_type:complete